jgi:crotonobetainyl-CoA:carnitine CoA-transferase CaiB-like acyl-CoA transferase
LAVFTDAEWQRCVRVLGSPHWALDPRFANLAGRITHRDDLDAYVEAWTSQRSAESVADLFQAAQIAAGIVADAEDLCGQDPHLAARSHWQTTQAAGGGRVLLDAITPRLSETPGQVTSVAPRPGDHTDQVLREILQMEETLIGALKRERIIA